MFAGCPSKLLFFFNFNFFCLFLLVLILTLQEQKFDLLLALKVLSQMKAQERLSTQVAEKYSFWS